MPEKKYKLCYPQLGNYDIPIQYFVNNGLHLEYLAPPPENRIYNKAAGNCWRCNEIDDVP